MPNGHSIGWPSTLNRVYKLASPAIPPHTLCKLLDLEHLKAVRKEMYVKMYSICKIQFQLTFFVLQNIVMFLIDHHAFVTALFPIRNTVRYNCIWSKYFCKYLLFNYEFLPSYVCSDTLSFATD